MVILMSNNYKMLFPLSNNTMNSSILDLNQFIKPLNDQTMMKGTWSFVF
jgi:hypothetical protein